MSIETRWEYVVDPLLDFYDSQRRILPWREEPTPYHVWVSEIMLQQTRVEAVKAYYKRFMDALPDIRSLAEAEEEMLLKLWEGLGYYNRVRNMQKAAQKIEEEYAGKFPENYEEIKALPGIGNYTLHRQFILDSQPFRLTDSRKRTDFTLCLPIRHTDNRAKFDQPV